MAQTVKVEGFLAALKHARKDEIASLRAAILSADPAITERVKWNAPSFCWQGEDRVTMRLNPGDRLELVFHRGATAKAAKVAGFEDKSGLIEWAAQDRGVVRIADSATLERRKGELAALALAWMKATG